MTESPVFVVFGATGGIGSALVHKLSEMTDRLVISARRETELNLLASEVNAVAQVADATNAEQVEDVFDLAIEQWGKVDGVANCVGSILLKPVHLTSEDEFNSIIATNLTSAFLITKSAAKRMSKADGGSVVLVSSAAARVGLSNHEAIAAAKAGIIGLTLSAAATYGSSNVRFNCVAPGLVQTPMTERITSSEASLKYSQKMHALGRIGQPEDIANAIAFLLDPANSWITGQVIGIDGGLGAVQPKPQG